LKLAKLFSVFGISQFFYVLPVVVAWWSFADLHLSHTRRSKNTRNCTVVQYVYEVHVAKYINTVHIPCFEYPQPKHGGWIPQATVSGMVYENESVRGTVVSGTSVFGEEALTTTRLKDGLYTAVKNLRLRRIFFSKPWFTHHRNNNLRSRTRRRYQCRDTSSQLKRHRVECTVNCCQLFVFSPAVLIARLCHFYT
jgi:hypothetical protein